MEKWKPARRKRVRVASSRLPLGKASRSRGPFREVDPFIQRCLHPWDPSVKRNSPDGLRSRVPLIRRPAADGPRGGRLLFRLDPLRNGSNSNEECRKGGMQETKERLPPGFLDSCSPYPPSSIKKGGAGGSG